MASLGASLGETVPCFAECVSREADGRVRVRTWRPVFSAAFFGL